MQIVVVNHLTLDGVMQGPGRADEDTRGGFTQGGWAAARTDDVMMAAVGRYLGDPTSELLLGRRSYDSMLSSWNDQGGPFKDSLNAKPKHVASTDPDAQLAWPNSTLIHGDVPAAVAALKQRSGGLLVMMGSGELIRSLLPHGLIDELLLMIHPVVLGSGHRLFRQNGTGAELRLTDSQTTSSGVILATYVPA